MALLQVSDFIRDYDNPLEAFKSTAPAVSEQYKGNRVYVQ